MDLKEYYLMHKNLPVCLMEISDDGSISRVRRNTAAADHFPLGGQMNEMKFHEWWRDRAIPKTRHGAKAALQRLGYTSTGSALVNNLGLSLTDCYWIQPRGEDLSWEEVNLFTNDFVDSFGEITLNPDHNIDLRTRTRFDCASSQGELQKKWCIDNDGKRYLVKGNYGLSYQQSINEVFASTLHARQGFRNYTQYYLTKLTVEGGREGLGCLCYAFSNNSIECLSAWDLLQTVKIRQNESYYYPLKKVCLALGMPEQSFTDFIDYEIMTDYLITNTDRHMTNIAVLRDPDSLRLIGFAPIFDSGNSMFYNVPQEELAVIHLDRILTHSFIAKESRLLQYVQNRSLVNPDLAEMDFSVYEQDIQERHSRIPLIKELFQRKLDSLAAFQSGRDIWKARH